VINAYKFLVGKHEGKIIFVRPRRRREDNIIKIDNKGIG
jgi:hypothetical protein